MCHSGKRIGGGGPLAQSRNKLHVKTCNRSLEVQSFSGSREGKITCVLTIDECAKYKVKI